VGISAYGFRQPVVVDRGEVIIIGHLRRAAARMEGFTQIPVHVAHDLTPAQVRGLRLMDNRSHEEADWDTDFLEPELKEFQGLDFDLALTGFDDREIDDFLADPGLGHLERRHECQGLGPVGTRVRRDRGIGVAFTPMLHVARFGPRASR
jgi:ParB-like chromosome segregation protein Spo0J